MNGYWWSVLPPIPLLGICESSVESFDHYTLRMAASCGLSNAQLHSICLGTTRTPLSKGASTLSRSLTVERLTGNTHLRHGTLWAVSDVLHARPSKAGSTRRWCPLCYSDWVDGESREMLVTELDICLVCPIHRCALASHCPACTAPQGVTTPYRKRRTCSICGTELGSSAVFPRLDPFEAWIQAQAEALSQFCATPEQLRVHPANLRTYLSLLSAQAKSSPQAHHLKRLLQQGRAKKDDGRRTLHTLLNACAIQGVSVIDALVRPEEAASRPLLGAWTSCEQPLMDVYRMRVWPKRGQLLLSKLTALHKEAFLPNPRGVLGLLNLGWEEMCSHDHDLCDDYDRRYRSQGEPSRLHVLNLAFARVLHLQTALRRQGRRRSRHLEMREAADLGLDTLASQRICESATLVRTFIEKGQSVVDVVPRSVR